MENFQECNILNNNLEINKLLFIEKIKHDNFKFFINFPDSSSFLLHNLLGLPEVPLIGKYSKNCYEFCNVISLVSINYEIDSINTLPIKLPFQLQEFISNYVKKPNQIITNNTKFENQINFTNLKKIKFVWIVSNNSILDLSGEIFNIVPHTFLFKEISFEKSKRLVKNYPICIFEENEIRGRQGINEYEDLIQGKSTKINFNNLRWEFSSTHLNYNSLSFSPNNLKFLIKKDSDLVHFYVVLIEDDCFNIFYYWFINKENKYKFIEKTFSNSSNLNELFINLKDDINDAEKYYYNCIVDIFK